MRKPTLVLFWIILTNTWAAAQPVPTLLKNAEREAEAGHFAAAAELWERAGRLKNANAEMLFQAAEAYAQVRDYRRAADCYQNAATGHDYPLASLRYARALKQQGRYKAATQAFETFALGYGGDHKAILMAVAENEIEGCKLALQSVESPEAPVLVSPFPDSVNTAENEFSPISLSDNLLYFSLASENRTKFMRAFRQADTWQMPQQATSLPDAAAAKFRNGCFSPDGNRFYYSACEGVCRAGSGGSARPFPCELYCLTRMEDGWAEPERLRSYINLEGSTAMFPHVAQSDGVEYLFFSSDRPGGLGGLDLYVCQRPTAAQGLDFSYPQNLGWVVNTGADEVTPFFEADTKTLWFSSMGHPSVGGLDIFRSEKAGGVWSRPINLGIPVNSPADDCFFVLKKNGSGAFLTSNRSHGASKTTTCDDDIFEVNFLKK